MRNIIIGLLSVALAGLCIAASFPNDGKIYAIGYGSKNATVLQSVIDGIGTTERTIVLTGGSWDIDVNLSIPTNVTLEVIAGSYLDVANGVVVTADCTIVAGIYKIFDGSGTANGSCSMLWRPDVWGDTNQFQIGDGLITLQDAQTLAEVLAEGNNASNLTAEGFSSIQATTGIFDNVEVNGIWLNNSNDMAESFMGYPKLTLDTGMVTVVSAVSGVAITPDAFTNIFDNSTVTCGTGTTAANAAAGYKVDLGTNYVGVVAVKIGGYSSGSSESHSLYTGVADFTDNANGTWEGGSGISVSGAPAPGTWSGYAITPFSGRYIGLTASHGGSGTSVYNYCDMSVYAVTNGYENMGGF